MSIRRHTIRGILFLMLCGIVLPIAMIVESGNAQAFAPMPPGPYSYLPFGESGGASAASGYGIAQTGATVAAVDVMAPVIITTGVTYGIYYGLSKEWNYFHPQAQAYTAPGATTHYGGGSWFNGNTCAEGANTYDTCTDPGKGADNNQFQYIMETAPSVGAFTGPFKMVVMNEGPGGTWTGGTASFACGGMYQGSAYTTTVSLGSVTIPVGGQATISGDVASTCAKQSSNSPAAFSMSVNGPYHGMTYKFGNASYPTAPPSSSTVTATVTYNDGTTAQTSATYDPTSNAPVPLTIPKPSNPNAQPTGVTFSDPLAPQGAPITFDAPATWTNPSANPYPNCAVGGSAAPCIVRLGVVTATGFQTCGDQIDCTQYQTDPNASTDTDYTVGNQTYECRWGPYPTPLANCDALGSTQEGTATAPTNSTTPTGSAELGLPPLGDTDNCFPHGWGMLNPVSWVEDPVKCALKWAFVPSVSVSSQFTALRDNLEAKPPLSLITLATNFFGACLGVQPAQSQDTGTAPTDNGFPIPANVPDAKDYLTEQPVSGHWQLFQGVGDWMQGEGHYIYVIAQIGIIGGFAFWIYQRIARSLGGKE